MRCVTVIVRPPVCRVSIPVSLLLPAYFHHENATLAMTIIFNHTHHVERS
jgi:hypothetical protein